MKLVVLGLNCGGSKKVVHVINGGGGGNRLSNPSTRDHCSRDWRSYEHMDCSYFCMTYENQTTLDCRPELFSTLQQKLQSLDSAHYSIKRYGTKSNPEGVVDQTISSRSTQLCRGVRPYLPDCYFCMITDLFLKSPCV